mmetsp:Transcript_8368/g.25080  ORF Transcript_8368/g.25080 Transcript_8368/m.25080 type:complete len:630 (-) Transcript_8368:2224-4113(-)|eukprot:CAMPEP_0206150306 /NCGR_PEP_ID=MMETSP1473-20131121/38230_1 /ASSEMBLY_ACC=CAM_ASM_001109 /TAXON_ID=1461547 /ORGANISM="Stichococcus sp, Strain RCC1054" /LENGTH=629 /DNA_ID=CAMNT_0053547801 /DNA_START=192 /DNA_END=2081 /DNA_ORIENTATION=+
MAQRRVAAAICACLAVAAMSVGTADAKAVHRGFIRMQDGLFVDQECREFNFVGANAWRWVQLAANQYPLSTPGNEIPSTDYLDNNGKKINPVLWAIRQLHAANVTVVRLFAAGTDPTFAMIQKPGTAGADGKTWPNGKYNWDAVTGLDKVVGWCRAHGIKVILSFVDNWSFADSKTSLIWMAGNATGTRLSTDEFYSNKLVKDYYKNFVSFILNHVNKQTGLQFKEDPTILGYNLMNEPRCNCAPEEVSMSSGLAVRDSPGSNCANIEKCFTDVQAWVKEMAGFVKSIAPKQLVGVGDEGFASFLNDADNADLVGTNPGSWSAITGDSVGLHSIVGIDYHSTHMWVDDWGVAPALPDPYTGATGAPANPADFTFHRKFLEARVAAARADGKPFVIEEFGKYISRPATSDAEIKALRDPWFQDIFDIAAESQKSDGPIKGLIMWKYGVSPYHNNTDKNWVNVKDTTWTDIVAPQGKVYNFRKTAVPNCRPATGKAQLEGRGISTMSTSPASGKVTTMSAVLKATHYGRKLLGRELRSDGPEDLHLSSYISYGLNMAAVKPGKPIPGVETLTKVSRGPAKCARACGEEELCTAFHYNKHVQECKLVQSQGTDAAFDSDGWQTYWQEDVFDT